MAYKQSPFPMIEGTKKHKEAKQKTEDWLNIRSYLKGEQGLIPDYKGESTAKTASKVSSKIQKGIKKGIKSVRDANQPIKQVVKNMLSPKMTKEKRTDTKKGIKKGIKEGLTEGLAERRGLQKMTKVERKKEKVIKIKPKKIKLPKFADTTKDEGGRVIKKKGKAQAITKGMLKALKPEAKELKPDVKATEEHSPNKPKKKSPTKHVKLDRDNVSVEHKHNRAKPPKPRFGKTTKKVTTKRKKIKI